MEVTALNEFAPLTRVALKHARDAFRDERAIASQWQSLNYPSPPDLRRAVAEYDAFADLLASNGAQLSFMPADERTGLDSLYVRDASIAAPGGMILVSMGKALRAGEPAAQGEAFAAMGVPVIGRIEPPGTIEGGDLIWFDANTVAIGEGYRTNADGIRQLRELLGPSIDVIVAQLPHWHGAGEVLHLMSLISPVDSDLAVVYSPLMPVPFRSLLLGRGFTLIETPPEEFDRMATNVLALAPRRCVMLEGNTRTRAALEAAGVEVLTYKGDEISVKGAGGPTCLTRPITRSPGSR